VSGGDIRCSAVIVAAGSAQRMQGIDKLLAPLDGVPVLRRTVEALASAPEIAELIVDTVCSARKTIRIAGDDYPAEVVKSRFMKLDSSHVRYVMDCMRDNTTYVRNIKKYLLAALYNAPSTISNYYSSLVQHDMYGDGKRGRG